MTARKIQILANWRFIAFYVSCLLFLQTPSAYAAAQTKTTKAAGADTENINAENTEIDKQKNNDLKKTHLKHKGLDQFWYNHERLAQVPEPKPEIPIQCYGIFYIPPTDNSALPEAASLTSQNQVIIADKATYNETGVSIFEGNVRVNQGDQIISSERMEFDHAQNSLLVTGDVSISEKQFVITSRKAEHDLAKEKTLLSDTEFLMVGLGLKGKADSVELNKRITTIQKSAISTCPPNKDHWLLKSKHLKLDQEKGWGVARNAKLEIVKVPVLYTPYFTFPLDDRRKTGFLYPGIGHDSVNGTDITVPFYMNIAPNYDATLTPRYLSDRGTMLSAELRYLNLLGEGALSGDILEDDQVSEVYDTRKYAKWTHFAQYSSNLQFNSDYQYLSDPDYFVDFSGASNSELSYLERKASLDYLNANYYVSVFASDFQLLDPEATTPYRLLPQLNAGLSLPVMQLPLEFEASAQITQFDRSLDPTTFDPATGALVTGQRSVVIPSIEYQFDKVWGFFKPKAALHARQYDVKDLTFIGEESKLDENVPIYTLDSGLIFERDTHFNDLGLVQTLEPRLFFVKIPFREQDELPNFDSNKLTFNSNQLFRTRRFSGHDVVGDTEQVTVAVTSRFYSPLNNQTKARFTLGQIHYLDEQEIQPETEDKAPSAIIANSTLSLFDNWGFASELQWNAENNIITQTTNSISYRKTSRQLVNMEHRYRPATTSADRLEESTASMFWQLLPRWSALAVWNFDLEGDSTISIASGLEYENCCLIVRALNRKWKRSISSTSAEPELENVNSQTLELQLKGLGKFNDKISKYISKNIDGFNE